MTQPPASPEMLAVGTVEPAKPGHPWWKYRRMDPPLGHDDGTLGSKPLAHAAADPALNRRAAEAPESDHNVEIIQTTASSGLAAFVLGAAILAAVGIATQLGASREGPILVPIGAIFLAVAASQHLGRRHPDEPWLGRLVILGTVAKLGASYARYFNLTVNYNGAGDATGYDGYGRQYASAWLHGGAAPVLKDLRETNFVRWFTGVVYYVFGSNLMTGTFVFALLALIGSYLWYRATADAVPIIDKRLYLLFVLFAPSIAFWPSLVGKEALMQLGLGALALGASQLFRQRLVKGLAIAMPAGWLVWVVRPHLLALVAVGIGVAYLGGRVSKRRWGLFSRPLGIIMIAFLVAFTVGQGAKFLGINSLSLSSVQSELDQETASTGQGGSHFNNGGNSLNPINFPGDVATVLLRPFPWEAGGGLQLLASLEGVALAGLLVVRFRSLRVALARSREIPFLMFCWVLVGLYSVAFASFANFGLLVRERSLVLPAVFVLIAVNPTLDRAYRQVEDSGEGSAFIGT